MCSSDLPEAAAYPAAYRKDGYWTGMADVVNLFIYNKARVKAAEAPQRWTDLLDPKWRGKMVWSNSQDTGAPFFITELRQIMGEDKALAYLRQLGQQNIAVQSASA